MKRNALPFPRRGAALVSTLLLVGCQYLTGLSDLSVGDDSVPNEDASSPSGDSNDGGAEPGEMDSGSGVARCDAVPSPVSCEERGSGQGLDCGASQDQDCCDVLCVPGGEFLRSYDGDTFTDESAPAQVTSFALDRYQVTVGRFRAFVESGFATQGGAPEVGAGAHPTAANSGWQREFDAFLPTSTADLLEQGFDQSCNDSGVRLDNYTETPGPNDTQPINCTNFYLALAFCIWDGGRLPSEAEWNYAAAGGAEQRIYPWGGSRLDVDENHAQFGCDLGLGCEPPILTPVGSFSPRGDGRWGHADLAGNLYDWLLDTIQLDDPNDFPRPPYDYLTPCNDCVETQPSPYAVIRGGNFFSTATDLRTAQRGGFFRDKHSYGIGIRCARDLENAP